MPQPGLAAAYLAAMPPPQQRTPAPSPPPRQQLPFLETSSFEPATSYPLSHPTPPPLQPLPQLLGSAAMPAASGYGGPAAVEAWSGSMPYGVLPPQQPSFLPTSAPPAAVTAGACAQARLRSGLLAVSLCACATLLAISLCASASLLAISLRACASLLAVRI